MRGTKQSPGKKKNNYTIVPIDSIEQITGIDFYPSLPDDMEAATNNFLNF
ncbi:hypothetical protein Barb7_00037 [Bacteroidales bacterium Barb7]|nr:hypothetical protein Barb7_00062 [Bacteroidales bacterium Barb7]OAV76297.1 hypothetical protein Barb7_00011 [Bacteroidales bacterium Barb7]OAV76323.1 hypothetical protein Barb7_00037 [Bacteroidales bacterium Barb7]